MYTNAPTPGLYRVAELQRREAMTIAAKRRRHELLNPSPNALDWLRYRVGATLIAIGNRLAPASEASADIRQATTA